MITDLSTLTAPQLRLLESLAEKPAIVRAKDNRTARVLAKLQLIECFNGAAMQATRAALVALLVRERQARQKAERGFMDELAAHVETRRRERALSRQLSSRGGGLVPGCV